MFEPNRAWFTAVGIPITPFDDRGVKNYYPMMRFTARDANGAVLAMADVVLPVSDEMDCRACHASGGSPAARPAIGWAFDANAARDVARRKADSLRAMPSVERAAKPNDNVLSTRLQGHPGMLAECDGCHTSVPSTVSGGPHGLHPLGASWISRHGDIAENGAMPAAHVTAATIAARSSRGRSDRASSPRSSGRRISGADSRSAATPATTRHRSLCTVTKSGSGSGVVTSAPEGIDCGDKCSATFNLGTAVTLTAIPESTSAFSGWSGACSGTRPCVVSMTQQRSVTATFSQVRPARRRTSS